MVVFNDRNANRKAFHISEIGVNLFPICVDTRSFYCSVQIHNGDYLEAYALRTHTNSLDEIESVDLLEVIYDREQELNFLH